MKKTLAGMLAFAFLFAGAPAASANATDSGTIVCGTYWTGRLTTITTSATTHDWRNRLTGATKTRFWGYNGGQKSSLGYSNSAWVVETSGILSANIQTTCIN
jgi:hypothetical protein